MKERGFDMEFEETEVGADTSFNELPEAAKVIARELIDTADNENRLVMTLDRCVEYREATGETDWDAYPQSVDAVARYWRWVNGVA